MLKPTSVLSARIPGDDGEFLGNLDSAHDSLGAGAGAAADVDGGARKQRRQAPYHVVKKDQPGMVYRFCVRAIAVGVSLLVILLFVQGITGYSFASIWQ